MENKLKIIFVGIPDMALIVLTNLLSAKFNIVGVVPPKKDNETYSFFKNFVITKGLNFLEFENSPNEKEYIEKIKELNADIGVVASYNNRFSKDFLSSTKMGYINCHPSLLPEYRGGAPYFHIVKNQEKTSGITLHFMDETFDTGDIIYQEKMDILPFETMGTLFNRTNYMLSDALVKVLTIIEKEGKIKRIPQPEGCYKEAPKTDGNFTINWQKDVFETEALIRACNPFFNARTIFRQTSMKIIKAKAIRKEHNLKLGYFSHITPQNILISAKGGFLSLDVISLGTWGIFNCEDFYYMFSPKEDEFLG